jgi:hypothetical protein
VTALITAALLVSEVFIDLYKYAASSSNTLSKVVIKALRLKDVDLLLLEKFETKIKIKFNQIKKERKPTLTDQDSM